MGSHITLGQILDAVGSTLLTVSVGRLDVQCKVQSVEVFDPNDFQPLSSETIVLGAGVSGTNDAVALIRAVAASKAAAVVLRERLAAEPAVRAAIEDTDQLLLSLTSGASWTQVTSILTNALNWSGEVPANTAIFGDADSDLFNLANSIAGLVKGPVTIEDVSSRIVAFSRNQDEADYARKESVLGHQVGAAYNDKLKKVGAFRRIYASPVPVFIDSLDKGIRPREAMRLQAGGEILGSIWAVVDSPLSGQRKQGMAEAANIVALAMLRRRVSQDSTSRLRTVLVSSLLEGGGAARDAAGRAGIQRGPYCILAVGLTTDEAAGSNRLSELQRITNALNMYLNAASQKGQAALLQNTIYAVFSLGTGYSNESVRSFALDFTERIHPSSKVVIGIGQIVPDVGELSRSRRDADFALRVLRSYSDLRKKSPVATSGDVQTHSLLLRMTDMLADSQESLVGPLVVLAQYDATHESHLLDTLCAWLDFFGDVVSAANSLHIHKNTFRYRMGRLCEVASIDLEDSDTRFGLMLQIRLFAHQLRPYTAPATNSGLIS